MFIGPLQGALAHRLRKSCSIDLLIDDIREELRGRPYDLVSVAGGWKHLTRPAYADAIRTAFGTAAGGRGRAKDLTQSDVLGMRRLRPIDIRASVLAWERRTFF